jgi:Fe2+ transport system protein FeoA
MRSTTAATPLSSLSCGARGRIVCIARDLTGRVERLAALGVSAGADIHVLQTFPGVVFECDQTELAVERAVASAIWVRPIEHAPAQEQANDAAKPAARLPVSGMTDAPPEDRSRTQASPDCAD